MNEWLVGWLVGRRRCQKSEAQRWHYLVGLNGPTALLQHSDFQTGCHGTLVCHQWSVSVPQKFGGRNIYQYGQSGCELPHPSPSTAWSALSINLVCGMRLKILKITESMKRSHHWANQTEKLPMPHSIQVVSGIVKTFQSPPQETYLVLGPSGQS